MAYDISQLQDYIVRNSRPIATEAVMKAATASLLAQNGMVIPGMKGSNELNTMANSVNFQDGTHCGRNPVGATQFSARKITVSPIKDEQNFCVKDLYNKVFSLEISKGQHDEKAEYIESGIAAHRQALVAAEIEKLLWKGDKALTTGNMKFVDGFLKIIGDEGTPLTLTGSDIIAKLQSSMDQFDITESEQDDFRIFIGKDTYNKLELAKFNAKFFNPGSDAVIPGTSLKYEVLPGLNGTGKLVASRFSNLVMGVDADGDSNKVDFYQSPETKLLYMDFYFALGVQVVFPDKTYIATI